MIVISIISAASLGTSRQIAANDTDPDLAADAAPSVDFIHRDVADQLVVEVDILDLGDDELSIDQAAARLLDVAHDGSAVAVTDGTADQHGHAGHTGELIIIGSDGSERQAGVPAALEARFGPDATWLAALDGGGALWRVDAATGASTRLADGPFSPPIAFDLAGRFLLRSVPSVEAPYRAALVALDPASGRQVTLSGDDELVYTARGLDDGSVAYVAHMLSGATALVLVAAPGERQLVIELADAAIHPDIAPDGRAVAYEIADDGVYLAGIDGRPRRIRNGSHPAFSPDGTALLVRTGRRAAVIDRGGTVLLRLEEATAAWACGRCRP